MAIIAFSKVDLPYGWLGNMSPFPITFEEKIWKTSEALFQALRFDNEKIREELRLQLSPMGAKMKAKTYRNSLSIVPCSDQDVENMKVCLKLKFTQHTELREKLLRTGDHTIVEDLVKRRGDRHLFWGAYKSIDNEWVGKNTLGLLLMSLRTELKSGINSNLAP